MLILDAKIAVILTTISFTFLAVMFMVWMLLKRKRFQRRNGQVSVVTTINEGNGTPSSTPSIFSSSNRSISPLINFSFEKESLYSSQTANVDTSSNVITIDNGEDIRRTYTLKEVDKICMEALKGPNRVASTASAKTKEQKFEFESTKTLFTKNNDNNNNNINSQRRWGRCSSGYGSATSSIASSLQQKR